MLSECCDKFLSCCYAVGWVAGGAFSLQILLVQSTLVNYCT